VLVDIPSGISTPEEVYEIASIHPPPPMIEIPDNTPEPVRQDLESAFQTYWHDSDGCIAKVRASAEKFLDNFGVPRTTASGKFISFNDRILSLTDPRVSQDWLDALREVGNLGTHGSVQEEKLFHTMDIWKICLMQAYGENPRSRADALARLLRV
jgi:Domain of unknown function (DUF4145)